MKIRLQQRQLVIGLPAMVVKKLGLKAGDNLDWEIVDNKIVLQKEKK